MKFENLYIKCKNLGERQSASNALLALGYDRDTDYSVDSNSLMIAVYKDGSFIYINIFTSNTKELSYQEFMKIAGLRGRIMKCYSCLGLNKSELSLALGYSKPYISKTLAGTPGEKKIDKLCAQLDALISSEKNKKMAACEGVSGGNHGTDHIKHGECDFHKDINDPRELEIKVLKLEIENKNEILEKRKADLENTIVRVNELEDQLKTTQDKFIEVVDQKDKDISKINGQKFFAEEQLREKKKQIYKLDRKFNNQAIIYMIAIAILFITSIIGFAS